MLNGKWPKLILLFLFLAATIIGFMIKLPSPFRRMDKELHTLFYFLAAAFLNILFAKRSLIRHLLLTGFLYLFGVCIEFAQEYSNKLLNRRIHGRFDPQDVVANTKGLIGFSILWLIYLVIPLLTTKNKAPDPDGMKNPD